MWIRVENGEDVKPQGMEKTGNGIILRRRFQRVEAAEEKPTHWEYDEWQMTADQYEVYQDFESQIAEQSDALVELAELLGEVMV